MATSRKKLYFSIMSIIITLVLGVGATYAWFTNINQQGFGFVIESDSLILSNSATSIADTTIANWTPGLKETAYARDGVNGATADKSWATAFGEGWTDGTPGSYTTNFDGTTGKTIYDIMSEESAIVSKELHLFNPTTAAINAKIELTGLNTTTLEVGGEGHKLGNSVYIAIFDVTSGAAVANAPICAPVEIGLAATNELVASIEIPAGDADAAALSFVIMVWLDGPSAVPAHINEEITGNIVITEVGS